MLLAKEKDYFSQRGLPLGGKAKGLVMQFASGFFFFFLLGWGLGVPDGGADGENPSGRLIGTN